MFEQKYKGEMKQIAPSQDLIHRTKAAMKTEMQSKKKSGIEFLSHHRIFRRAAAFATAAAVILFAIFAINMSDPNGTANPMFAFRVYGAQLLPDGTYAWREMDITQLDDFAWLYDGDAIYIGLGLWFAFEGENIRNVTFSLENGFFATQYIGNWGQTEGVPRSHVGIPPDFTTSRLVMYGHYFDKIGDTIVFGDTMPDDILLFWGSDDISVNDWQWDWASNLTIEIEVSVMFEDGTVHYQPLIFDLSVGLGMGTITDEYTLAQIQSAAPMDWLTDEQIVYIESAPLEYFTLLPDALTVLDVMDDVDRSLQATHELYVGGHDPISISAESFLYHGITRILMGALDGEGFVIMMTLDDNGEILDVNAYSIPLH